MAAPRSRPTVAVQLALQNGSDFDRLRARWKEIESLGADAIYVSDHFVSFSGRSGVAPGAETYEATSVLAAIAEATDRVKVGSLVLGSSFRNPNLVADMARTIDHISGGRMVLGLGAGYVEADYTLYGYEYGTTGSRLRDFEANLETIKDRFTKLNPPPLHTIPIMIGGGGEKVVLRLVAQYADIWSIFGPDDTVAQKVAVFEDWCEQVGRDPTEIVRSTHVAYFHQPAIRDPDPFFELGFTEFVVGTAGPDWPLDTLHELLAWRDALS